MMKTKVFILISFVLLPATMMNAQIISDFGFKAAFTKSKLEINDFTDFSTWRSGFNMAVFFEHRLHDYVSIGSQVEYAQKGYRIKQVETDITGAKIQDVYANTRLDYLSVPVFVKINYPTPRVTPFLALGPRFDYLFNYNKGEFKFTSAKVKDDMAEYFESYAIGGFISAGVKIPATNKNYIITELRYNFDSTDSAKDPILYSIKNKTFDIWVGIEF